MRTMLIVVISILAMAASGHAFARISDTIVAGNGVVDFGQSPIHADSSGQGSDEAETPKPKPRCPPDCGDSG